MVLLEHTENKNFAYYMLKTISFPLRMIFDVCPSCHQITADLLPCKCTREDRMEEGRRIKEWHLNRDIHCIACSTKNRKQELNITKIKEYDDGVGWSFDCPTCKVRGCTNDGTTTKIPVEVKSLYDKQHDS